MKSRIGNRIDGKFGEVSLYDISTGGKGCILALNYEDFIIDAAQLGQNCLNLLLEIASNGINLNIVYKEPLYIFEGYKVCINGKEYNGYETSKAMEGRTIMTDLFKEGLHVETKDGTVIDIPINAKVSIIRDDSATGKTKLIRYLSDVIMAKEIKTCNYDISMIIIIRDMAEYKLFVERKSTKNNIIFIDKFDMTDFKE